MKSLYEQKANKCKHFNGLTNKTCDAGVPYDSVKVSRGEGQGFNFPCWKDRCEGTSCDKLQFLTDAEIKAEIEEYNRSFERIGLARKAIVEHLGGPWKKGIPSAAGLIDCPACKGVKTLHFRRSGYNGHVHAICETKDCVCWME